jgi:hypothetical protein
MLKDDTRTLKRKVDSIITNIAIYKKDISRYKKKLQNQYDIEDLSDIKPLIESLEEGVKEMNKKEEKLLQRASHLLKDIS